MKTSRSKFGYILATFLLTVNTLSSFGQITLPPGLHLEHIVKAYRAKMKLNGEKCEYRRDIAHNITPQPSQYNVTDSCFYLTFELSPMAQSKGKKTALSVFVALKSTPQIGEKYPLIQVPKNDDDDSDPIVRWTKLSGDVAAIQVSHMPLCKEHFTKNEIPPQHKDDRIILESTEITNGTLTITEFEPYSKNSKDAYIKLQIDCDVTLTGGDNDEYTSALSIRDAQITLYYVKQTQLEPLFFPIDYGWGNNYVPKETF